MTQRGEAKLVEIADGVHAYMQQGSWGFSNAGLIAAHDASLLVDTLYDLRLTQQMLDTMRRAVPAAKRIATVVNTHANGDHCWGNQLVADSNIIASRATAEEMRELSPRLMHVLVSTAGAIRKLPSSVRRALTLLGRVGVPRIGPLSEAADFVLECFGAFEFGDVRLTLPTQTFDGQLTLNVRDKVVELIEVGPAHTKGDAIAVLPRERVVFSGDILFNGSHPIIWEGPISNWIAACDRILSLDVDVVVPGHGPITDMRCVRETRDYWQEIIDAATRGHAAGATADDVARELLGNHPTWGERHRLVVNIDTAYRDLTNDRSHRDPLTLFARMSRLERCTSQG